MRGGASGHAGGGCQRVRGGDAESKRNAPLETDASPDGHRGGRWTWHRSAMGVAFAGYGARPGCAPLTSPIVRPPRPFPGGPRGARLNWGVWLLRQPRRDAKNGFRTAARNWAPAAARARVRHTTRRVAREVTRETRTQLAFVRIGPWRRRFAPRARSAPCATRTRWISRARVRRRNSCFACRRFRRGLNANAASGHAPRREGRHEDPTAEEADRHGVSRDPRPECAK